MRDTYDMPIVRKPLAETHPALAQEADGWDPKTFIPKSHDKVSWKCKFGHSWEASINNRTTHNTGCPVCSNRKLHIGFNDLATVHPDLAAEADGWDPKTVLAGTHARFQWRCRPLGHAFTSSVDSRVTKARGCPVCSKQLIVAGENDLATTHPHIAKEAMGWDPTKVSSGNKTKVEWKCSRGHIQVNTPLQRTNNLQGCTICSGREVLPGFNDLVTTHPNLANEADGWDSTKVSFGSNKAVNWKCAIGHRWKSKISSRTSSQNSVCPVCQNLVVEVGFNDLATTHPQIAADADGWDPKTVTSSNTSKKQWKCPDGHLEVATITSRAKRTNPCGICNRREVVLGINDLTTTHPLVAQEADGWDPSEFHSGSPVRKPWKCSKGHKWSTEIRNRADRSSKCPFCTNSLVSPGENDLETVFPDIAKQADGWNPTEVLPGTKSSKNWKCEFGHTWTASVQARTALGSDCPVCVNQKVLPGFNDLATLDPDLAKEAKGWDPSRVGAGSKKKQNWVCKLGHEWKASPGVRSSAGTGCPICSFNVLLTGFNDLATTNPELASQANGWDPSKVISGSTKKVKWACAEGHSWHALISARKSGRGCPYCSKSGFNPGKPGWLYFLEQPDWEMLQIGITNFPDARVGLHQSRGWNLLEIRGPMDGLAAQKWETGILNMLKRHGADLSPTHIVGKFDGYSEAWVKSSMEISSIKEMMALVREDEMSVQSKKPRKK
jgi:hypothetical protein